MTKHADKVFLFAALLVALLLVRPSADISPPAAPENEETAILAANLVQPARSGGGDSAAASPQRTVYRRTTNAPPPAVAATLAGVADLATEEFYFAQEPDRRWPMASISKLFSAAYVLEHGNPTAEIALQNRDFERLGGDANASMGEGQVFTVHDLIQAMLLFSSNESAEALANSFGREKFVAGLNDLAETWGLTATHLADPTGLSSGNQSTVRDLVRLARKINSQYPEIFAVSRQKESILRELSAQADMPVGNINIFAGEPTYVGGKTGYTLEAGGNLLSVFLHSGRPIAIVVLGSADRFGDTAALNRWFADNFTLANY